MCIPARSRRHAPSHDAGAARDGGGDDLSRSRRERSWEKRRRGDAFSDGQSDFATAPVGSLWLWTYGFDRARAATRTRLLLDTRRRDGGVREELAAGIAKRLVRDTGAAAVNDQSIRVHDLKLPRAGRRARRSAADHRRAAQQPFHKLPSRGVEPENVAHPISHPVAVEIASAGDRPGISRLRARSARRLAARGELLHHDLDLLDL